eukprot:3059303-Alexandrium_andersonii.AAC.1
MTADMTSATWHLYIARDATCNPQSPQGSSALRSASIRNPACGTCKIASSVRTWNCAGPRTASNSAPDPE